MAEARSSPGAVAPPGPRQRITTLLLAGGAGQRMGGVDKGLMNWRGRPLGQHALERLAPQGEHAWICANRNLAAWRALGAPFGAEVISDADPTRFDGPLAGMLAGLRALQRWAALDAALQQDAPAASHAAVQDWLLTAPCDAPDLPRDLGVRLFAQVRDGKTRLSVAENQGKYQAVFCLMHSSLAASLEQFLARGQRKVGQWVREQGGVAVPFDEATASFLNANTLDDLASRTATDGPD